MPMPLLTNIFPTFWHLVIRVCTFPPPVVLIRGCFVFQNPRSMDVGVYPFPPQHGVNVRVLKKCVVLQVNDAAVNLRLVVFVSKVQRFYIQITSGGQIDNANR
jgi:hypothetical protein